MKNLIRCQVIQTNFQTVAMFSSAKKPTPDLSGKVKYSPLQYDFEHRNTPHSISRAIQESRKAAKPGSFALERIVPGEIVSKAIGSWAMNPESPNQRQSLEGILAGAEGIRRNDLGMIRGGHTPPAGIAPFLPRPHVAAMMNYIQEEGGYPKEKRDAEIVKKVKRELWYWGYDNPTGIADFEQKGLWPQDPVEEAAEADAERIKIMRKRAEMAYPGE